LDDGDLQADGRPLTEAPVKSLKLHPTRTMFVAMTRAMRALLVLPPARRESTLYEGFEGEVWNTG
jgi:hypothetical protein